METYFLQSQRIGFRHWSVADVDLAMGLWGDPDVTRLIGGPFNPEQVQARLMKEVATQHEHGFQYWPIFLLTTGDPISCCGLRPYKPEEQVHEIGFHLCRRFWGQGYAFEAAQVVIAYGFRVLDVQGLFAGHHPANEGSQHLLAKLGFEYTHDEYYAPTGLQHPSYLLKKSVYEAR